MINLFLLRVNIGKYQSSEWSKTKIELKIPEINDFGQVPTWNVYHEKKTIKLNTLQNSYNFVSRSSCKNFYADWFILIVVPSESAIPSPDYGRSVETMTDPWRTPIDREHIDIQK